MKVKDKDPQHLKFITNFNFLKNILRASNHFKDNCTYRRSVAVYMAHDS
jgi:hypothetical protein